MRQVDVQESEGASAHLDRGRFTLHRRRGEHRDYAYEPQTARRGRRRAHLSPRRIDQVMRVIFRNLLLSEEKRGPLANFLVGSRRVRAKKVIRAKVNPRSRVRPPKRDLFTLLTCKLPKCSVFIGRWISHPYPPIRAFPLLLRAVWRGNKSPSIALRALVFSTRHRTLRYPPNKQSWPPSPVPPLPSLPALRSPGASSRVPPGACSATQDDVLARFFSKASGRLIPIGLSNRCPVRSERRELTSDPTFPAFSTAGSSPPSPRSSPASLSASTLRCVPPTARFRDTPSPRANFGKR